MLENTQKNTTVCIFGATSFVGESVIKKSIKKYKKIICFTRKAEQVTNNSVEWRLISSFGTEKIANCIYIPPLWTLPEYFTALESVGVERIVVLSSTSIFTKANSENCQDKNTSKKLKEAEELLRAWASERKISCTILRPTMIYGGKNNKNIITISKLIKKIGIFPTVGEASGLRQPVHYEDLSEACILALENQKTAIDEYNLSGGEILTYKEMVTRVFRAMKRKPRFIRLPTYLFKFGIDCLRILPKFNYLTNGMADRMNLDMIFDHSDATEKLGFHPRLFILEEEDVE